MRQRKHDETVAPTSFLWAAYLPNRYFYEVPEDTKRGFRLGGVVLPRGIALPSLFVPDLDL